MGRGEGVENPVPSGPSPSPSPPTPGIDLFTLVGQFTALRHEVNMQTKAARAAVEQNAAVLEQLAAVRVEPDPDESSTDDALRPVVKALVDTADALALSLRQMEKLRESAEPLLADLPGPRDEVPPPEPRPGFLARLFGGRAPAPPPDRPRDDRAKHAAAKLRQFVAAAADGYAMSLRRVERVLPTVGLERLACTGSPFDPELMEAVEVVGASGQAAGTVVEDVRPGYWWRGKVFRFAQVKVAR
ncbi:MAG: GrpE protein [Gemmataceae bacterium]|nr:GrpE protein [Gemmataceae bacterium]